MPALLNRSDMPASIDHVLGPPLSDLDHDLLEIVCRLRVVTQTQLERLHAHVPARTIRYRTQRLYRNGLLGRSRPYRERGSAPHHLWPTNRADALIKGKRPPRRGERREPNPMFVAHGAGVSELFVLLETSEAELTLREFRSEGRARVDFTDGDGASRAIVPDARVTLSDADGLACVANVELDLGTMTHARLRAKLRGYYAHAAWVAPACPPVLLFITTSAGRNDAFLRAAVNLRTPAGRALRVCASPTARDLGRAVSASSWLEAGSGQALTLAEAIGC
jgi:hypothetical protein